MAQVQMAIQVIIQVMHRREI